MDISFRQAPAHLALQEAQYTPDFLQRKAFAPQFRNHCNLHNFFGEINPLVPFMARGNHLALIPPLQLAETYLGDLRHIGACERPLVAR